MKYLYLYMYFLIIRVCIVLFYLFNFLDDQLKSFEAKASAEKFIYRRIIGNTLLIT